LIVAKRYDKNELEALSKDWDDAGIEGDVDIADGKYQMVITECRLILEPGKRRCACFKLKIVGGDDDYVGQTLTMFDGLERAESIGYFKKKLSRAGVKIGKGIEGIEEAVEDVVNRCVEVQIKNKDGFTNWYVNKLVSADYGDEADKGSKSSKADRSEEDNDADDAEESRERELPEQDEIDELNEVKAKRMLADLFDGIDLDKVPKKHKKAILKYLVAVAEGDDIGDVESEDIVSAAKALGLKVSKKDEDEDVEELITSELDDLL